MISVRWLNALWGLKQFKGEPEEPNKSGCFKNELSSNAGLDARLMNYFWRVFKNMPAYVLVLF